MKVLYATYLSLLLFSLGFSDCFSQEIPGEEELEHEIYLLGNTGAEKLQDNYPVINVLVEELEKNNQSSVLFLGNLFPGIFFPKAQKMLKSI